jgi:hypothetical protein
MMAKVVKQSNLEKTEFAVLTLLAKCRSVSLSINGVKLDCLFPVILKSLLTTLAPHISQAIDPKAGLREK